MEHPIFDGFSLEIRRREPPASLSESEATEQIQPIEQIELIDLSAETKPVIRTIRYLDYFPESAHGIARRKIEFIDNTTGQGGTISLQKHKYNAGLLDFLFEPPAVSQEN